MPAVVICGINDSLATITNADYLELTSEETDEVLDFANQGELDSYIAKLENEMRDNGEIQTEGARSGQVIADEEVLF